MRITHYLKWIRLEHGGVVRAVLDMALWQARAGHDVVLATCDDVDVPAAWRTGGPGLPRLAVLKRPSFIPTRDRVFCDQVEALIRETDVLHMHVIWDYAQLPFARACARQRKPYVQSPHGMLADWSTRQKRWKKLPARLVFARHVIDHATFIVLTAQGELDQSAKRHPKTTGVVLPLVFDTGPYLEAPDPSLARGSLALPPADVPSILYLSRLHYKKRPDLVLAAGQVLRDRGLRFNMVIAGPSDPGYDRMLREFATSLKVDDITTFTGIVPAACKPSLFRSADVFCLPTSMENFGFVYFEALASGTPVVTTKGTDTWPEILSSGGGTIVEMIRSTVGEEGVGGGDVGELAEALVPYVTDRARARAMGDAGRRWVLETMDPRAVTERYIAMYRDAAARVT